MTNINKNEKRNKLNNKNNKKVNDFPYKRLYTKDEQIYDMFNKLKKFNYKDRILIKSYELRNIDFPKSRLVFMNEPVLLINKDSDYSNWNTISDMFQEKCRMQCKLYGQKISAYDYWINNRDNIK